MENSRSFASSRFCQNLGPFCRGNRNLGLRTFENQIDNILVVYYLISYSPTISKDTLNLSL